MNEYASMLKNICGRLKRAGIMMIKSSLSMMIRPQAKPYAVLHSAAGHVFQHSASDAAPCAAVSPITAVTRNVTLSCVETTVTNVAQAQR